MNKWILAGSLGVVFLTTLIFSYGPGYGGSLLAFLGNNITGSPEMSPSATVTFLVTSKTLVTFQNVTNVTSVSPVLSPQPKAGPPLEETSIPTVSPTPTVTLEMSPQLQASPPPAETPLVSLSPATSSPTPATMPVPTATQSTKININTADLTKLDDITGVGPVLAQRIIDYRTTHGPFQKIEDIINVNGIGDKTFLKMKDEITI